ncbi:MAG: class I SAM-dependent methyltransferase [Pseudomonadota bacterium]|nr:class I SAM-dependent methyltransferase [Pseudomonadota bacterium]
MTTADQRIIGLYERHARAWDEDRRRARPPGERRWIERFMAAAPGARVLDMGCGSGEPIARDLVDAGRKVTGVDASASLIALCRERFPAHDWIVADMRRLDLGARFDGVLAWHSLFHLPADDQERMFPVFAAHAGPGAALMFTSGTERGESVGSWRGEPLYHASLDTAEYEALLGANGFTLVERVEADPACGGATVWLAKAASG